MFTIRTQVGAGPRGQGIGARLRLAQAIRRDHFRGREFRKILGLLGFRSEQQQRQSADAGVRAVPRGIGTFARHSFGDHHHRGQIHFHAAELFRNHDGCKA